MNVSFLSEAADSVKNKIQPTDYPTVKANAKRVFNEQELGFYIVEKSNPTNRSEVYIYNDYDLTANEVKERAITGFLNENGLTEKQVTVIPLKSEDAQLDPNFVDDNKIDQTEMPTFSQRVASARGDYTDSEGELVPEQLLKLGVITANNVKKVLRSHPSHSVNEKYTNAIIDRLLKPGSWKPTVVLKNTAEFEKETKIKIGKYVSDFGEIAGPLGLVCSSINGNGVRMLPYFFAAGDARNIPSIEEIKNEATIHFHPSTGHPLVDSYIEFRGQVVRVSSKGAGSELSGGGGATFAGIFKSIAEIGSTPEGVKAFNKLMTRRGVPEALRKLKILSNVAVGKEDDNSWLSKVTLLRELVKDNPKSYISITNNDLKILRTLWAASGEKLAKMYDFNSVLGAAFGSQVDRDLSATKSNMPQVGEFSQGFKNILRGLELNKYGEMSRSGMNDASQTDAYNSARGWWAQLQKGLVNAVAGVVNSDPEFGRLCTWILNHGAFIQIDMRSKVEKYQLNITNITATWPSTAIDTVIIKPVTAGSGYKYALDINGGRDWPTISKNFLAGSREEIDYADTNFGFTDTATLKKLGSAREISARDLLRFNKQWEELLGREHTAKFTDKNSTDKNKTTNASLEFNSVFKNLASAGIVSNNWANNKVGTVETLVQRILQGSLDEQHLVYVSRNVEYVLQYYHNLSKDPQEWVSESQVFEDEEGDEEQDIRRASITSANRARAVKELVRNEALIQPIYYALMVDRALRSGARTAELNQIKTLLANSLSNIGSKINVNSVLSTRRSDNKPIDKYRDFVPPNFDPNKAKKQSGDKSPIAVKFLQFLSEFRLAHNKKGEVDVAFSFPAIGNFCTGIIIGNYDNLLPKLVEEFGLLLANPELKEELKLVSDTAVEHAPEIKEILNLTEDEKAKNNLENDQQVALAVALIYWSTIIKMYEIRGVTHTPNFLEVAKKALAVSRYVFTDSSNYRSYIDSIKQKFAEPSEIDKHTAGVTEKTIQILSAVNSAAQRLDTAGDPEFRNYNRNWVNLNQVERNQVKDQIFDFMRNNPNIVAAATPGPSGDRTAVTPGRRALGLEFHRIISAAIEAKRSSIAEGILQVLK